MTNVISFNYNTNVVRTQVTDEGEPLFCANDVCSALGYSNTRDAVARHVDAEDVVKRDTLTNGGNQPMTYVNESGLYALIFGSKLESAKEFKHWVTSEVLPSIRKTGGYSVPKSPDLKLKFELTKMLLEPAGITGNQLTLALDKVYKANTGESLLAQAGVELVRPQQTQLSTPTELGNDMGLSGREVNKLLAEMGLQTKEGGKWQPTQKGLAAGATILDTGKKRSSGVPVTQLKWPSDLFSAKRYLADR